MLLDFQNCETNKPLFFINYTSLRCSVITTENRLRELYAMQVTDSKVSHEWFSVLTPLPSLEGDKATLQGDGCLCPLTQGWLRR
jgi:hypothetical protein